MGQINNKNAIRQFFVEWMHRDDFGNPEELAFVENATMRIGNDLKSKFLESSAVLTESVTTGAYVMPGDYYSMQAVHKEDGSFLPLLSATAWARLKATASVSCGYLLRSAPELVDAPGPANGDPASTGARTQQTAELELLLRPATGEDLTLHYMTSPQLIIANTDKNPVLVELQNIYLRAMLMEGHMYLQDVEMFEFIRVDYERLVLAANNRFEDARMAPGSAPNTAHPMAASNAPVRGM